MVHRRRRPVPGRPGQVLLTVLAVVLLTVPLAVADPVDETSPTTLLRVPVEPLVLLTVLVLLPARWSRTRAATALVAGTCLGVVAVFRGLDLAFLHALNRPFDPLIDWQYADALVDLLHDSFGVLAGTLLLAAAVVLALGLVVLVPLAVLRLARIGSAHRAAAVRALPGLLVVWLALALVGPVGPAGSLTTADTSRYLYGHVTRIPVQLHELEQFERAAREDPARDVPADELLRGLRGKDVMVVFVESYGRVALDDPGLSPGVEEVLATGTSALTAAGFDSRSAFLTSPTFGALSWLAHASLQSGLWVDSQPRYDALVTSSRLTLSGLFDRAGWRTVITSPANDRDWPQAEFYGVDQVYDSRNVGYRGPRFGYPTMPDQYTLDAFHRLELAPAERRPVMAEIDLITSHAPWSRIPRLVDQAAVGDGSVFDGMPEQLPSAGDIWPDPARIRLAYADSIEYSLAAVVRFLTSYGDDDLVVVLLGDHQPATVVSGPDAGHDVPVSLLARDPVVLDAISDWGWTPGLRPADDAPVWRMDAFRDRFLQAYAAPPPRATLEVPPPEVNRATRHHVPPGEEGRHG